MAVTVAQLKSPTGKIDNGFFPGEIAAALESRLQTYIAEGDERVGDDLEDAEKDEAVKLWAYYRAYDAVYLRLIATPSTIGITGEGNTTFTQAQIEGFATRAAEFKAAFEAMLSVDSTIMPLIPSGGVLNAFRF